MKDETKIWLDYAQENLQSAQLLFESHLYNPCLQNVQQAVEKALKALLIENSIKILKTHNISELVSLLNKNELVVDISKDDSELFDSIYLPSKYPLMSVLPEFEPDESICKNCIKVAENTLDSIRKQLS